MFYMSVNLKFRPDNRMQFFPCLNHWGLGNFSNSFLLKEESFLKSGFVLISVFQPIAEIANMCSKKKQNKTWKSVSFLWSNVTTRRTCCSKQTQTLSICIYKRNLGTIVTFSTPSNSRFPAKFKIELERILFIISLVINTSIV